MRSSLWIWGDSVRKRTWLLVGLALWWCLTPVRVWGVSTSASAAVLMDADTGQVLYDQNGGRRMLIASTTKIMTAWWRWNAPRLRTSSL